MTYEQIKKTIEDDYNQVAQARVTVNGKRSMHSFYVSFSQALEELHLAVGPFITSKEQFVEHIKFIQGRVSKDVYDTILEYCRTKLKLDI